MKILVASRVTGNAKPRIASMAYVDDDLACIPVSIPVEIITRELRSILCGPPEVCPVSQSQNRTWKNTARNVRVKMAIIF